MFVRTMGTMTDGVKYDVAMGGAKNMSKSYSVKNLKPPYKSPLKPAALFIHIMKRKHQLCADKNYDT
jgi:hypothetical protein